MKFLRLIFSRFFFVVLAIILQIVVFAATNFWLSTAYWWVSYIFTGLSLAIFLNINNKDKPASFKLPWTALVLFIPIVGITIYLMFGNYALSRKARKEMQKEARVLNKFCKKNEQTMEKLYLEDKKAFGQAHYIEKTCLLPTYENCYSEYLPTGEVFFEKLKEELLKAEKYIFMEYFIIERGEFWNSILSILEKKALEGVEIYFMYDDFGCISKIPYSYYLRLRDKGINACKFNPFKPIISVVHNNRDHRKITVIDGRVGFVGGINLADEYINVTHPYGKWKDNALMVKGKSVDSFVLMFIKLFNSNSIKKLDAKKYLCSDEDFPSDGYMAPYCDGPCPIYEDYIGKNIYLNYINQAVKYVYITTPYLIVDYEFLEALINASKRGVDVKIITPHIADKKMVKIMTKSNYLKLIENGVHIYEYKSGFIHAKMFVSDDDYASIGTSNLDYRSFVHHFECGVWLYKNHCIQDMKNDFENMIKKESVKINKDNSQLTIFERMIKDILRLIAPLI